MSTKNIPPKTKHHRNTFPFLHAAHWFHHNSAVEEMEEDGPKIRLDRSRSKKRMILRGIKDQKKNVDPRYQLFHEKLGLESLEIFKVRNLKLLSAWGLDVGLTKLEAEALSDLGVQVPALSYLTLDVLTTGGFDVPENGNKAGFDMDRPLAQSIMKKIEQKYKIDANSSNRRGSGSITGPAFLNNANNANNDTKLVLDKAAIKRDQREYKDIVLDMMSDHFTARFESRVMDSRWHVLPNDNYQASGSGEYQLKSNDDSDMTTTQNNDAEEFDANDNEFINPAVKHMIADAALDFQTCEKTLNRKWILAIKFVVESDDENEVSTTKTSSIVETHLKDMKIALEQLRNRLFNMLDEEEKTLPLMICARNWPAVKEKLNQGSGSGETKGTDVSDDSNNNTKAKSLSCIHDKSCHNRYPLALALLSGAPCTTVIIPLIIHCPLTVIADDWKSGRGQFTPLMIAHRQGNSITKGKSTDNNNNVMKYRVYEYSTTKKIKKAIWSKLDPSQHYSLSAACCFWMWDEAQLLLNQDLLILLKPGQRRATTQPDAQGIYPFSYAINAKPLNANNLPPPALVCMLIQPLTGDDAEEILRNGLSLTHQLGSWFVGQNKLFDEIVVRFWRLMDEHAKEIAMENGGILDENKKENNTNNKNGSEGAGNDKKKKSKKQHGKGGGQESRKSYRSKGKGSRFRKSIAVVPAQKNTNNQISKSTAVVEATSVIRINPAEHVQSEQVRSTASQISPSSPHYLVSRSSSIGNILQRQESRKSRYNRFVKKCKQYSSHVAIQWASTLPCRLPSLFRPTTVDQFGEKVTPEVTSKLLFVLYASIFEEINRVRSGRKPNPRRIQLLGESAKAARKEALRLQKKRANLESGHSRSENIFDVPLRELGRLIWSASDQHSKWFYNIQRKDDEMMRAMLNQFQGEAGTFLTTPLGFAVRTGSYHSIRALVRHEVCSPTKTVAFTHLNEYWADDLAVVHDAKNEERVMHLLQSIKDGYFLPPQHVHRTDGLTHGVTAYELAIVSKEKAKTKKTMDEWEKILQLFRKDPSVRKFNQKNACNRTMDFHHGVPELVLIILLIGAVAFRYSGLWGGVSTLQFADHHVAKFTEESFDTGELRVIFWFYFDLPIYHLGTCYLAMPCSLFDLVPTVCGVLILLSPFYIYTHQITTRSMMLVQFPNFGVGWKVQLWQNFMTSLPKNLEHNR